MPLVRASWVRGRTYPPQHFLDRFSLILRAFVIKQQGPRPSGLRFEGHKARRAGKHHAGPVHRVPELGGGPHLRQPPWRE
eukprot:14486005-Alexandrium_andersonii.AAC.1